MRYSPITVLSTAGSDRGTAYDFANKLVTVGDHTYAVWTDTIAITRAACLDRRTGQWSAPITLGEGTDNHNCPALTCDASGRLRLAYGPHGAWDQVGRLQDWPSGAFRYAEASAPDTLAGLEKNAGHFGYHATYACLVHTAAGRDAIVYRGGESPWQVLFQQSRPNGGWTFPRNLMAQDLAPGYTHVGAKLAAGADGTLWVAAHFYAMSRKLSLGAALLRSTDQGETWTDVRGAPAALPIAYSERFAIPHPPQETDPRITGLTLDADGLPWVLTNATHAHPVSALLSKWEGDRWRTVDVAALLPPDRLPLGGTLVVDTGGRLHVAIQTVDRAALPAGAVTFGHPSSEVYHLWSADGGRTFAHQRVSPGIADVASWWPSISQSAPTHPVPQPVILYTHGNTQRNEEVKGCRHTVHTEIHAVTLTPD